MRRARSNMYIDNLGETPIMEMRRDSGVFVTLDYSRSTMMICKAMRDAQVCWSKIKTGQTVLQDYTGISGTTLEQRKMSRCVVKCTKCAYFWCST